MEVEKQDEMYFNPSLNLSNDNYTGFPIDTETEIIFGLYMTVALLSTCANVFISFTTLKFQKLRREVTNILIVHFSILQIIYLSFSPLSYRLAYHLNFFNALHMLILCMLTEVEAIFTAIIIMFLLLIVLDSHLKIYHENAYNKFGRVYKFFVILLYAVGVCAASLSTQFCYKKHTALGILLSLTCFLAYVLFIIIINIIHRVKSRKIGNCPKHLGLAIGNIFILFFIPAMVYLLLSNVFDADSLTFGILSTLGYASPICNLWYLYSTDDNFSVFFRRVIKCECNDYVNATLEEDAVIYNIQNGVKIGEEKQV